MNMFLKVWKKKKITKALSSSCEKMDDKFFSKIAKSVSEFMILAIVKEKGESHTYEIQQTLLTKFSNQGSHVKEMTQLASSLKGKTQSVQEKKVDSNNKNGDSGKEGSFEFMIDMLNEIITQTQKDDEIPIIVSKLGDELDIINNHIFFPVKIWESISAIYQVMKDLEDQGFIEIARSEIVSGRTRKLYKITEKGELEAIRMMFIFNGIYTSIYPQFLIFGDVLSQFFKNHSDNLNNLFSKLMKTNSFNTILHDNQNIDHESLHSFMDPFAESQFQIMVQLLSLEEVDESHIAQMLSLINKKQNNEIIGNLQNYKQKIENIIKLLK